MTTLLDPDVILAPEPCPKIELLSPFVMFIPDSLPNKELKLPLLFPDPESTPKKELLPPRVLFVPVYSPTNTLSLFPSSIAPAPAPIKTEKSVSVFLNSNRPRIPSVTSSVPLIRTKSLSNSP